MKKVSYESPNFDFQELGIMERVADTCWGFHYGWFDPDGDGPKGQERIQLDSMGSCDSVEDELVKYVNNAYAANGLTTKITGSDVKTNSHSTVVIPERS